MALAIENLEEMDVEEFGFMYVRIEDTEEDALIPKPEIDAPEEAEKHLRALRYWRKREQDIEMHAAAEIHRIETWRNERLKSVQSRISWHESGLFGFLVASGEKTLKLIGGTVKKIAGRERVEVPDEEALKRWCDGNDVYFFRVETKPDKKAIGKHVKESGEIPDGCDIVTGEDTYKVDVDV